MWFTDVPLVPLVGSPSRMNTSTLGNLTISSRPPTVTSSPPRVSTQNRLCSSMLVTTK